MRAKWGTYSSPQAAHLARYQQPQFRSRYLLNNARSRAKAAGLVCTITREWIEERIRLGVCEVSGLPFILGNGPMGKGQQQPWSPSIDRRIPTEGYTEENSRVVVWAYNACKHIHGDEVVLTLAKALCARRSTPV